MARLAVVLAVLAAALPARAAAATITLSGPGATHHGHQVTFTGRLTPARQGVEVGIYLGSSVVARATTNANGFFVARPHLFTTGSYRARAPGVVSPPHRVEIRRPLLRLGSERPGVQRVVDRLASLGYAVHDRSPDRYTNAVRQTVYAFQKAQGLVVDGVVGPRTRAALRDPKTLRPRHTTPARHIEVDKERQLLLLVRDGRVAKIVNTSTAGIPGYHTPEGTFRVFRRVEGIDTSPLGKLWDPLYFYRGYAIHGSTSVPPHPASHGCVRIPMWEAARLFEQVPHGAVVYVY